MFTEAIIKLDDESLGAYPEIDQKGYRGIGNILCHSYHRVDAGTVQEILRALPLE